jgi:hypothetical protein
MAMAVFIRATSLPSHWFTNIDPSSLVDADNIALFVVAFSVAIAFCILYVTISRSKKK